MAASYTRSPEYQKQDTRKSHRSKFRYCFGYLETAMVASYTRSPKLKSETWTLIGWSVTLGRCYPIVTTGYDFTPIPSTISKSSSSSLMRSRFCLSSAVISALSLSNSSSCIYRHKKLKKHCLIFWHSTVALLYCETKFCFFRKVLKEGEGVRVSVFEGLKV